MCVCVCARERGGEGGGDFRRVGGRRDLEKEWGDRKKRRGKQDASLWEELADIGEEFVEFLEHELGLPPQAAQVPPPPPPPPPGA